MEKKELNDVGDAPKSTNSDSPRQKRTGAEERSSPGRVRVVIPRNQDDDSPVKVSFDGRAILIPRGMEVSIPREHFEVLKDAITTQLTGYTDDGMPIHRDIPRFAYTVVG